MDDLKRVWDLLANKETALARETYRKLRRDCLVIDGRKTGDKVRYVFFFGLAEHFVVRPSLVKRLIFHVFQRLPQISPAVTKKTRGAVCLG